MNATPQHLGKYELLQQLGRGGVGDVWKARDLQLRRDVAIKILHSDLQSDPHFLTRFTHEGQHIASLHHSNIVQVHEINVTRPSQASETTAYIAMEYIEGQTLSSYLRDTSHRGIFPTVSQIVYLFQCLGAAIDYAHQKNIVHGNVKPNNILLNMRDISQFETGEPMLSDFALPRLLGPNATISTPAYMAPEQARGLAPAGRSDIYALGVILYEICTGVQPFRDESSVAVMMQHINAQPTPPIQINPGIPLALSEVILHALTKEASARFPSGTALAHAIADACSSFTSIQGPRQPTNPLLLNKLPRHGSLLGVPEPSPMPNEPSLLPRTTQSLPGTQSSPTFPIQAVQPSLSTTRQFSQPLPKSTFVPPSSIQDQFSQPLPPLPEVTGSYEQNTSLMVQAQSSPIIPPTPPASATPAQPPSGSKSSSVPRYIYIVTIVLLVLLVGATLLASVLRPPATTATPPPPPVRQMYFQDDAQGINDLLHIELQNIDPAPTNQTYFAWLNTTGNQSLPLGPLTVQGNNASLAYEGDGKHTNLLSIMQGISITLENSTGQPSTPSNTVVYRGNYDPNVLTQLKNILYITPDFPGKQSVAKGLLETIKSMNDKAGSIVDVLQGSHDYEQVRRQATRIIEAVDGTAYAQSSGDLPPGRAPLLKVPVGLISSAEQPGYIDTLAQQISLLKQQSGNNNKLLQHTQNVENAIVDLNDWIQKIRVDAIQILKADNLADPAILNTARELKQLAADSYTGHVIPPSQAPEPALGSAGALQAYIESQYAAALDLQPTK